MTRKAVGTPTLFFCSQLDVNNVTPGYNKGRLNLYDDLGHIGHWVFSTTIESRQTAKSWEQTGGAITPNFELDGGEWFTVPTKLIVQPGQPVAEGYIVLYKGSNSWKGKNGVTRSEIMIHEDSNYTTSPGSLGCLVAVPDEWKDFKQVFKDSCCHLESVRLAVSYTY